MTLKIIYSFTDSGTDGAYPVGELAVDANGDIFGTTEGGGSDHEGTVFEIKAGTSTATTLYDFTNTSTDGGDPTGLTIDAQGDLFGATETGGADGTGTVFEIKAGTTTPSTFYSFTGAGTDGGDPKGGLTLDANGDLFGTTLGGGSSGDGAVFEIKAGTTTATTLYSFTDAGTDGAAPEARLTLDAKGDLFGTTESGGSDNDGTVFEIKGGTTTAITLYSFTDTGTDGAYPEAGLTIDANGDLFGTTESGGSNDEGAVFEIKAGTTTPTTLYSFNGTDGAHPLAGLTTDASGDLFGTTSTGDYYDEGAVFEITDSGFVICFLPGTQITTPSGEVAIERLKVGDAVSTVRGDSRRIVWIGHGRVLATRGRRNAATPVIVRESALADNVPNRDLHITKAHSLYVDGVLIPAEYLINHRSIIWDDHAQEIPLYHIELETHDVLLANGAPAESYRDDGNRRLFQNANSGWHLPAQEPYAPVLMGGPLVDAIWRRLLDRADHHDPPLLTEDADLHVVMDGERVDAEHVVRNAYIFSLPAIPSDIRIASRATAPAELGLARDPRPLGVAVRRVVVRAGTKFRIIEADDKRLDRGFHAFETHNEFRWTDGDAALPQDIFTGFTGAVEVIVHVAATARYLGDGPGRRAPSPHRRPAAPHRNEGRQRGQPRSRAVGRGAWRVPIR
jgi:uncharacterized repeat protein (TIGR03803 family)